MLKQFRLQAVWLSGALLLIPLLAACGVAPPSTPVQTATTEAVATTANAADSPETEQAASASTSEPEAQQPTAIAQTTTAEPPATSASSEAGCQPVDIPNNDLIAPVSDQDWSQGPADAPVTLIEYGDFQ
jgi:hypothetical protein